MLDLGGKTITQNKGVWLTDGTLRNGTLSSSGGFTLIGAAPGNGGFTVSANLAGSGNLTKSGAGTATFSGVNTYTGNSTVNAGTLTLAAAAQLKFVIGATSGVNNSISGAGTVVLAGDFNIDTTLTDATALTDGTWVLENVTSLNGAYDSTFRVLSGVTPWSVTGDIWTKIVGSKIYTFDETTGTLTLSSGGATPEIALEGPSPLTTNIVNNTGTQDFGTVLLGANTSLTFTIRNTGTADLTDLIITKDGTNAADFTVSAVNPAAPVPAGGSATFSVQFAPSAIGAASAAIHIANNTTNANPFSISLAGAGTTAYNNWTVAKGLTALNNSSGQDPDNDGTSNLAEFGFNGNPLSGSDNGKVFVITTDNDSSRKLILTIAVLANTPVFSANNSPAASYGGITYTIQGSSDLDASASVSILAIPVTTGLPPAGTGYEYRSFSLDSSAGLTGKGFLSAQVAQP